MNTLNTNDTDTNTLTDADLDNDSDAVECIVPRRRLGKIARLPEEVREDLNQRLFHGEHGPKLLQWLNDLPETKEVIKADFKGKPVSKQNLSDWRKGGYAEWRLRCDLVEQAHELQSEARELRERQGSFPLADDLVTVFTARYAALLRRWDGEVTETFSDKVRVFSRIRRDLLKMQQCARETMLFERKEEERDMEHKRQVQEEAREYALAPHNAAWRREHLATGYGDEAGERHADLLDRLDYEDHPFYPDLFAHSHDAQRPERDAARRQRNQSWARTQGRYEDEADEACNQGRETAGVRAEAPLPRVRAEGTSQGKPASGQGTEKSSQSPDHQATTTNPPSAGSNPVKPFSQTPVKAAEEPPRND